MTPTQRRAALRLADALTGVGFVANDLNLAAALLRELAAEPVQEPSIWIQSNHLQHAKNAPYLARTGPTKLMSDFIPLYASPQPQQTEPSQDTPPQGDDRKWTLLLAGEQNGLVGKYGDTFQTSPDHYERVNVYAAPQQRRPPSDEFVSRVVRSVQPNLDVRCKAWAEQFDECKHWLDAAYGITGEPT